MPDVNSLVDFERGTINPRIFSDPEIYKLEQERSGMCILWCVVSADATVDAATATGLRLAETLAPNRLRVAPVDYIACERSGKFQSTVSQLSA